MGCTGASRDAPTSFGFMVFIYGEMVERGKFSGGHKSRPYGFWVLWCSFGGNGTMGKVR